MVSIQLDRITGLGNDLSVKAPCICTSTSNITLAGLQAIDGYTTLANDRVLVNGQTIPSQNGIYIAGTGTWIRAADLFNNTQALNGTLVLVTSGAAYINTLWHLIDPSAAGSGLVQIGSDNITFGQTTGPYLPAQGGTITGNLTIGGNLLVDGATVQMGTLALGAAINEAGDIIIASGASVAIGAAASNNIIISGTTTITAFDNVADGITRKVRFSGVLTLTHSASLFLMNNGSNIVTAANDEAVFESLGAGSWKCRSYTRASGMALANPASVVLYNSIAGLLPSAQSFSSSTVASLTVTAGQAADSTNSIMLSGGSFAWNITNGNALNGYQGGTTLPNSSTIHFFLIGVAGLGTAAGVFASTSLTPTIPGGYTLYRRIFSLNTNSSGVLLSGGATEIEGGALLYYLSTQVLDISVTTGTSASRTLYTLTVPSGIIVRPLYRATGTSATYTTLTSGGENDMVVAANLTAAPLPDMQEAVAADSAIAPRNYLTTNTSGQIGARSSSGTTNVLNFNTSGFIDFRRN